MIIFIIWCVLHSCHSGRPGPFRLMALLPSGLLLSRFEPSCSWTLLPFRKSWCGEVLSWLDGLPWKVLFWGWRVRLGRSGQFGGGSPKLLVRSRPMNYWSSYLSHFPHMKRPLWCHFVRWALEGSSKEQFICKLARRKDQKRVSEGRAYSSRDLMMAAGRHRCSP